MFEKLDLLTTDTPSLLIGCKRTFPISIYKVKKGRVELKGETVSVAYIEKNDTKVSTVAIFYLEQLRFFKLDRPSYYHPSLPLHRALHNLECTFYYYVWAHPK